MNHEPELALILLNMVRERGEYMPLAALRLTFDRTEATLSSLRLELQERIDKERTK